MAKKEKIDIKEIKNQDFTSWEEKDIPDKVVDIAGKKFLLRQPADSDRLIMALTETDQAKVIKNLCLEVVVAPKLDGLWDRLDFVWKLRLGNEVSVYLGITTDFLDISTGPSSQAAQSS